MDTESALLFLRQAVSQKKNILIIGQPGSGKTYITEKVKNFARGYFFCHTDDYLSFGYKQALYKIIQSLEGLEAQTPTFIEGVQGYRLLRKGVELDFYCPDIVIEIKAPLSQIEEIYSTYRPDKNFKMLQSFNKMHQTILNDYFAKLQEKGLQKPLWLEIWNIWKEDTISPV